MNPHVVLLLAAVRTCANYPKISYFIIPTAGIVGGGFYYFGVKEIWTEQTNTMMGLLLIADWIWSEINFTQKRLKCKKVWSYQYIGCFAVLFVYHMIPKRENFWIEIGLPRIIWAIIAGSIMTSFTLKMGRRALKRNFQLYLVLFLALLQVPKRVLYFGMVLSAMRILNFLFKRASLKNYLYPILLSFIGYIGLFMLNFTDRKLPNSFAAAFVGLRDFNIVFSLLFFVLAMMSTMILGMLFLSYFNQDLELLDSEELEIKEENVKNLDLRSHAKLIRKRNIILYGFLFNCVMISAAIKTIVYREKLRAEGVMEKFMVDAVLYSVIILLLYFML